MSQFLAVMTLAVSTWYQPTPDDVVALAGDATYMGAGVMATVARNRGLIHVAPDAPQADLIAAYEHWLDDLGLRGAVALNRAGDLSRRVWIEGPNGVEGPFLSIDCAQKAHYLDRETAGRIVEVDYPTAERWGMAGVGPVPVRVLFEKPGDDPPRYIRPTVGPR